MHSQTGHIPPSILSNIPSLVRREVTDLSLQQQSHFVFEYSRRAKRTSLGYLLWFLLSAHYAYMGRWGLNILMWVMHLIVIGAIWWIIDIFRIPGMVRRYNEDVAKDILWRQKMSHRSFVP